MELIHVIFVIVSQGGDWVIENYHSYGNGQIKIWYVMFIEFIFMFLQGSF